MDSDSNSCSRTRSGLVRIKNIISPSDRSCSRTRSGLVRVKSFMHSSDGLYSGTRSGLVRVKSFLDSSDSSSSRTRSGLVRIKSFLDSSDGSGSRTQSELVGGSSSVSEALSKDEAVMKVPRDGWLEDTPVTKRPRGRPCVKGLSDGCSKEEMPSRTRSGLVRRIPFVKALSEDRHIISGLPDGWQGEDMHHMPSATRSGLVRGSPVIKTPSKNQPVIKGLADGSLKDDKSLGTRSGLVRGSFSAEAPTKAEQVTKGQPDGWLGKEKSVATRRGLVEGIKISNAKTQSNVGTVIKGLPEGWRKEDKPRKPGSTQKSDRLYIDPVSGYEFRSIKDVHRYLQTGDIRQCAVRPTKRTVFDVPITDNQTHTSTSQEIRPRTADKAIQCEILTSEGVLLPWEELVAPDRANNTENTMSLESESMKAMEGYGDKLETLEHESLQSVSTHAPRKSYSVKRKEPNAEVKSKKRKKNSAATPIRASPRLAALNVQHEVSIEPEDQLISVNLVNRVQIIEENADNQPQVKELGTVNQIHGTLDSSFCPLQFSQADTANGMHAVQEQTMKHSQPSEVHMVHCIETNQENTATPMHTVQECIVNEPSQGDAMNHLHRNQENTANQLQSSPADTVTPIQTEQDYTNHLHRNQENTANQLQSSPTDTVTPIQTEQDYTTCQLSQAETVNHMQANLESIADQLQLNLSDTVIPIQEYTTDCSQPINADTMNQIQANQEYNADQLHVIQSDSVTQIQAMQGNMTKKSQLCQADTMDQIHIDLENITNHLEPNFAENPMLQAGFSWAHEQNDEAPITDFWKNVESQESSLPMQIDGAPAASFPANVKFQNAAAVTEPALPTQAALPETASDQSGQGFQSLFGNSWSDPCIEFAFKTLTGDIPILDDTAAVTDYFPEQQDLNKSTAPNCSASAFDNTKTHTQVDINLPLPMPSDKLNNGSWFPPQ